MKHIVLGKVHGHFTRYCIALVDDAHNLIRFVEPHGVYYPDICSAEMVCCSFNRKIGV